MRYFVIVLPILLILSGCTGANLPLLDPNSLPEREGEDDPKPDPDLGTESADAPDPDDLQMLFHFDSLENAGRWAIVNDTVNKRDLTVS